MFCTFAIVLICFFFSRDLIAHLRIYNEDYFTIKNHLEQNTLLIVY